MVRLFCGVIKRFNIMAVSRFTVAVANTAVRFRFIKNSYRFKRAMGYPARYLRPVTYGDKMQWRKLFERDPRFVIFCDKKALRDYVERMRVPIKMAEIYWYGHDANAIPFDSLPNRFVLKPSHLSGRFWLCDDKRKFDIDQAKTEAARWMRRTHGLSGKEWAYRHVQRGLIAEEYLPTPKGQVVPPEYRVFCFAGEPTVFQFNHAKLTDDFSLGFYDPTWQKLPWCAADDGTKFVAEKTQPKPVFLDEMCQISRQISSGFGHMRIDFFGVGGQPYLAEITPYSGSGCMVWVGEDSDIDDRTIDRELGALWPIPTRPVLHELADAWSLLPRRMA